MNLDAFSGVKTLTGVLNVIKPHVNNGSLKVVFSSYGTVVALDYSVNGNRHTLIIRTNHFDYTHNRIEHYSGRKAIVFDAYFLLKRWDRVIDTDIRNSGFSGFWDFIEDITGG